MELALQIDDLYKKLSARRRRVVLAGVNAFARELLEKSADTDSLAKVEATGQAAVDAVDLLMRGSGRQVSQVTDMLATMRQQTEAEDLETEELEASGRLQLLALYRAVEEASLSVAELESAGISRQRLKQLRDQHRLLGIRLPFQRGFLYPRWQFEDDLTPKPFLPRVLDVAQEAGLDALTVHQILTNPAAGGGVTPLQLCEDGRVDTTLDILRTFGESGG